MRMEEAARHLEHVVNDAIKYAGEGPCEHHDQLDESCSYCQWKVLQYRIVEEGIEGVHDHA